MTGWAGVSLDVPNRSGNDLRASGYSIAVIGDTQPDTLTKLLEKGLEQYNGWLNRFLWCAVRKTKKVSRPRKLDPLLSPFLDRLKAALAFAKQAGELTMDGSAESLWDIAYDDLSVSADSVPHTNRAEPYVIRLAMLYALADSSKVIKAEHLQAALALWSYCQASAKLIFLGPKVEAVPDPLWLQVLNAIGSTPGITRTGLHEAFNNRLKAEALADVLTYLERNELAYRKIVQPHGGGRPAEHWYSGKPDGEDEGELVNDNLTPLSSFPAQTCELTNLLPSSEPNLSANTCELTNLLPDDRGKELISKFAACELTKVEGQGELISSFAPLGESEWGEGKEMLSFKSLTIQRLKNGKRLLIWFQV